MSLVTLPYFVGNTLDSDFPPGREREVSDGTGGMGEGSHPSSPTSPLFHGQSEGSEKNTDKDNQGDRETIVPTNSVCRPGSKGHALGLGGPESRKSVRSGKWVVG